MNNHLPHNCFDNYFNGCYQIRNKKMVDWKAAMHRWAKNSKSKQTPNRKGEGASFLNLLNEGYLND